MFISEEVKIYILQLEAAAKGCQGCSDPWRRRFAPPPPPLWSASLRFDKRKKHKKYNNKYNKNITKNMTKILQKKNKKYDKRYDKTIT